MGFSVVPPGPSWNRLGDLKANRKRTGDNAPLIWFLLSLNDVGFLWASLRGSVATGPVLERSGGLLEHVGSHLERSCAILFYIGGLALYFYILEVILGSRRPSWSHLGPNYFASSDPHRNLPRLIPKVRAPMVTMCAGCGGVGQCGGVATSKDAVLLKSNGPRAPDDDI